MRVSLIALAVGLGLGVGACVVRLVVGNDGRRTAILLRRIDVA